MGVNLHCLNVRGKWRQRRHKHSQNELCDYLRWHSWKTFCRTHPACEQKTTLLPCLKQLCLVWSHFPEFPCSRQLHQQWSGLCGSCAHCKTLLWAVSFLTPCSFPVCWDPTPRLRHLVALSQPAVAPARGAVRSLAGIVGRLMRSGSSDLLFIFTVEPESSNLPGFSPATPARSTNLTAPPQLCQRGVLCKKGDFGSSPATTFACCAIYAYISPVPPAWLTADWEKCEDSINNVVALHCSRTQPFTGPNISLKRNSFCILIVPAEHWSPTGWFLYLDHLRNVAGELQL